MGLGLLGALMLPLLSSAMGGPEEEKEPFVSVPAFAKANGFKKPRYTEESVTLSNRWNRVTLHVDSRKAVLNGVQMMLNVGVMKDDDGWHIDKADVRKTLQPLLQPMEHLAGRKAGVIVIDPGHGGTDTGTHGPRIQHEKDLALEISRQVFLDLILQGYQVLMTRTGDTTLTLSERTDRAKLWKADLFVSIHLNASPSSEAKGPETYVLALPGYHSTNATPEGEADGKVNAGNEFDDANIILGHALHANVVGVAGNDRGLRRARFQVLRDAPCPAVLVECGYLTNADEETRLITPAYREKMAKAIVKGIHEYCGHVMRGQLATATTTPIPAPSLAKAQTSVKNSPAPAAPIIPPREKTVITPSTAPALPEPQTKIPSPVQELNEVVPTEIPGLLPMPPRRGAEVVVP
jgi:N-acetylmuramoyl-L-alanine amidase